MQAEAALAEAAAPAAAAAGVEGAGGLQGLLGRPQSRRRQEQGPYPPPPRRQVRRHAQPKMPQEHAAWKSSLALACAAAKPRQGPFRACQSLPGGPDEDTRGTSCASSGRHQSLAAAAEHATGARPGRGTPRRPCARQGRTLRHCSAGTCCRPPAGRHAGPSRWCRRRRRGRTSLGRRLAGLRARAAPRDAPQLPRVLWARRRQS